ncbi:hypothetical protein SISSUDRAFT_1067376 [Sistotremastrum suecicum HHB10207 ss-3]|uniref:Uncharacterized protein n=1 Tax=Sistotremastrum suecicum HHB10207 ss-3 TaxID=1314776 RepID=A0A165X6X5_9AGAM|nr:hypothetical protein SISSUDRAFT_1067376 [Sistotremastrum suecicum HHB10207 ss-3]
MSSPYTTSPIVLPDGSQFISTEMDVFALLEHTAGAREPVLPPESVARWLFHHFWAYWAVFLPFRNFTPLHHHLLCFSGPLVRAFLDNEPLPSPVVSWYTGPAHLDVFLPPWKGVAWVQKMCQDGGWTVDEKIPPGMPRSVLRRYPYLKDAFGYGVIRLVKPVAWDFTGLMEWRMDVIGCAMLRSSRPLLCFPRCETCSPYLSILLPRKERGFRSYNAWRFREVPRIRPHWFHAGVPHSLREGSDWLDVSCKMEEGTISWRDANTGTHLDYVEEYQIVPGALIQRRL